MFDELIQKAIAAKEEGDIEHALDYYNDAFNLLIDDAGNYARELEKEVQDLEKLRALTPVLFAHSKDYLKRDRRASETLNAMGVLFGELGDDENAKQKFEESIVYIPDGSDYNDPHSNLSIILSRKGETLDE